MSGVIYGVGLGPGDPDLMSVKAHRLLKTARHIAYFRKTGRPGHARQIAGDLITGTEHPMDYPVTTEIPLTDPSYNAALAAFYDTSAAHLRTLSAQGDVVVLCEGDPFFYGSFMHLYARLTDCPVEVIPATTGMSAAWTATGQPITWGDDVLTVLTGTLSQDQLTQHMTQADALVVMKTGRNLPKIRAALKDAGKLDAAWIVEYAAMPTQTVQRLTDYTGPAPYFSIVLVHGQGRRP